MQIWRISFVQHYADHSKVSLQGLFLEWWQVWGRQQLLVMGTGGTAVMAEKQSTAIYGEPVTESVSRYEYKTSSTLLSGGEYVS